MISLIRITQEAFTLYRDQILFIEQASFPSPWSAKAFMEETSNPVSHFWALKIGERILAYICFWMYAGEIHLLNIAVAPEWRRKGLATALIEKMKQFAQSQEVKKIYLEVRPSNSPARRLYQRAGFEEKAIRRLYYTDTGEDAIIMEFTLKHGRPERLSESASVQKAASISGIRYTREDSGDNLRMRS